ncbi:MAG: hypothetical protein ACF8XB_07315 [Planctomycetota bacterium JB042]
MIARAAHVEADLRLASDAATVRVRSVGDRLDVDVVPRRGLLPIVPLWWRLRRRGALARLDRVLGGLDLAATVALRGRPVLRLGGGRSSGLLRRLLLG